MSDDYKNWLRDRREQAQKDLGALTAGKMKITEDDGFGVGRDVSQEAIARLSAEVAILDKMIAGAK